MGPALQESGRGRFGLASGGNPVYYRDERQFYCASRRPVPLTIRTIIARDRFAAARAGASTKSGGEHEKKMQGRGRKRRRVMRSAGEHSARIVNRNSDIEKGKA
jgi:hypothetical protein